MGRDPCGIWVPGFYYLEESIHLKARCPGEVLLTLLKPTSPE